MVEPAVIYENKDFVILNKPSGWLVHRARVKGQETGDKEITLVDWLLRKYPEIKTVGDAPAERPGIVHRLDRETSGIMVVARTQSCFDYLKSLFQNREISKKYIALLWGELKPLQGVVQKPIGIKDGTVRRSVHSAKMAKEAITRYSVQKYLHAQSGEQFSFVELEPLTGRTHQLRVHMKSLGHPVAGDALYGPKKPSIRIGHLMLHAFSLEFVSSEGHKLAVEADPPEGFQRIMGLLSHN